MQLFLKNQHGTYSVEGQYYCMYMSVNKVVGQYYFYPELVIPTFRTRRTSSKNLSRINPVQRVLLFRDVFGSTIVASPVGRAQVLRNTVFLILESLSSYAVLEYFESDGVVVV